MRATTFLVISALAAVPALAQEQKPAEPVQQGMMGGAMMQNGMMQNGMMQGGMMGDHMRGMHAMTVTVTALDAKTGLVDASSGNMALKLHFPPSSLAGVKAGDKLSVRISFSKL